MTRNKKLEKLCACLFCLALALAIPAKALATGDDDALMPDSGEEHIELPDGNNSGDGTTSPAEGGAPDVDASAPEAVPDGGLQQEDADDAEAAQGTPEGTGDASEGAAGDTPDVSAEPAEQPEPEPEPEPKPQIVADGVYLFRSELGAKLVLDSEGTKAATKTNVLIASYSGAAKQAWHITFDSEKGLYQIWRTAANGARVMLEVQQGAKTPGTNVRLWSDNGTLAQYWDIQKWGSGYRIVSALATDYGLAVRSGSAASGANVQMDRTNTTKNQRFFLFSTTPAVEKGTESVPEGTYQIVSTLAGGTNNVADIASGSYANDANVRMYKNNHSIAQRFHFAYRSDGTYEIAMVGSGHVLDAAGGGLLPGTNVQQHNVNGTAAQHWVVEANANGTFTLINARNGLALDISGGSNKSGANLQLYTHNGTPAQQFVLKPVDMLPEGLFTIKAVKSPNQVLDIKGASAKDGGALQMWRSNDSLAQKFQLVRVGADEYRIRTAASGGWLTAPSMGSQVIQRGTHATAATNANTWHAEWVGNHMVLVNKATGGALTMNGGSAAKGSKLVTAGKSGASSQRFMFYPTVLLKTGCYFVQNSKGPYLDVAGSSTSAGANVQVWASTKAAGQYFYLEKSGSAWRLKNAGSKLYLTAAGTGQRANVAQRASSTSSHQKWKAVIADGGAVSFIGVASGRALDVAGGSSKNGANVQLYTANQTAAQGWKLIKTTYKPYTGYMLRAVNAANASRSATKYLLVVDKSHHKVICMTGGNGNWKPHRTMSCSVGATRTPTVEGSFTVGSRGYSFGSGYTCYYWTQFYGDYLFHSVLYQQGTRVVQDGRLGLNISHGCVRMDINDAYWIYSTIPSGTRVIVYS